MEHSSAIQGFARNKQEMLGAVAEAFGWDVHEVQMNPDPEFYECMREWLRQPFHSEKELFLQELPPQRSALQRTHAQLYAERRMDGKENETRLRAYDPSHSDLIEAMYDQYVLCYYWEACANRQHEATRDDAQFNRQWNAIEGVKAQIAPYYLAVLKARGLDDGAAVKLVGTAVFCFVDTMGANDRTPRVLPERDRTLPPDSLIREIKDHARVARDVARAERDDSGVAGGR